MKNIPLRVLSGIFGLFLVAGGIYLLINQAQGKGIDLDEEKWAINFIPGIFWAIMLYMLPIGLGIYFVVYAITGSWPRN